MRKRASASGNRGSVAGGPGGPPSRPGGGEKGRLFPRGFPKKQNLIKGQSTAIKEPRKQTKADVLALAAVEKFQDRIVKKAQTIIDNALKAQDSVSDEKGPPPKGFLTWHDYRVARDALLPKRDAPVYLDIAAKTLDNDAKIQATKTTRPSLNLQVVTYVQGAPPERQMQVIEVPSS